MRGKPQKPQFFMFYHKVFCLYPILVSVQGVLEAIRISCAGYPTKRAFDEFLDRFVMLATDVPEGYKLHNNISRNKKDLSLQSYHLLIQINTENLLTGPTKSLHVLQSVTEWV